MSQVKERLLEFTHAAQCQCAATESGDYCEFCTMEIQDQIQNEDPD